MKVTSTGEIAAVAVTGKVEARPPAKAEKADKVSTAHTEEINQAVALARRTATGARAAQLQSIENQLRSGTFKPSAGAIAERLLQAGETEAVIQAALRR
jgi:anti-sigma28 factor (negative regulator of flagellin synthesis)